MLGGADHADRDCGLVADVEEPERIAECDHPFPDDHVIRVPECRRSGKFLPSIFRRAMSDTRSVPITPRCTSHRWSASR